MIGANSVVTKDLPAGHRSPAGAPARVIKAIEISVCLSAYTRKSAVTPKGMDLP